MPQEPRAFPGPISAFPGPLASIWSWVFSPAKSKPVGRERCFGAILRKCPGPQEGNNSEVGGKSPFQPHLLPACPSSRPLKSQPSPAAYSSQRGRWLHAPNPGPGLPSPWVPFFPPFARTAGAHPVSQLCESCNPWGGPQYPAGTRLLPPALDPVRPWMLPALSFQPLPWAAAGTRLLSAAAQVHTGAEGRCGRELGGKGAPQGSAEAPAGSQAPGLPAEG